VHPGPPANRRPSPLTLVVTFQMGGAINRVAPTETAFAERSAPWMSSIRDNWEDPADSVANIAWVQESFREMFALLERHDVPELNFLRLNPNVVPAPAVATSRTGDPLVE
jgi:hypothetical protein